MTEIWTIVTAAVLVVIGIYHFAFRNLNYFKKSGVPFVPPVPLLGNMSPMVFQTKTFADALADAYNYNRDAKYVGFFDFSSPVIILRDPEVIKSVTIKYFDNFPDHKLLADEVPDSLARDSLFGRQGQRWREARTVLSPVFTSSKMKTVFKLLRECTANLIYNMKLQSAGETRVFEITDILRRQTNDGIASSAFGISVDSFKDPQNDFYQIGQEATSFTGSRSLRLYILRTFPILSKLFGVKLWTPRITNFFKNVVKSTIAARKERGIVRADLIQLMMQANEKNQDFKMTDEDMAAHAFVFYFGGFDTTSLLTIFAVHEIAMNPDIHRRLQAEVDQVLEQSDDDGVSYEALHGMQYLDAVVNETLRLRTTATLADRLCRQRFELPPAEPGLKPFTVEPGVSLWLPIAAIHRDPKYFPKPREFLPDRFFGSNKDQIDPATFIPFGSGPRYCIGNRFALMEAKLVIFELMANFNVSQCSKTVNPIKMRLSSFAPEIDGGVWLKIQPRHHS